jgi:hypothetical protein
MKDGRYGGVFGRTLKKVMMKQYGASFLYIFMFRKKKLKRKLKNSIRQILCGGQKHDFMHLKISA